MITPERFAQGDRASVVKTSFNQLLDAIQEGPLSKDERLYRQMRIAFAEAYPISPPKQLCVVPDLSSRQHRPRKRAIGQARGPVGPSVAAALWSFPGPWLFHTCTGPEAIYESTAVSVIGRIAVAYCRKVQCEAAIQKAAMLDSLAHHSHDPSNSPIANAISPLVEMGAYEALWNRKQASFKTIADLFREHRGAVPSDFVDSATAEGHARKVLKVFKERGIAKFGIRVHGAGEYPSRLRDAEHPIELLYYRGDWKLADNPRAVAVVGTRNPSDEGVRRAKKLVHKLVEDGFVIVSGLAKGIDTVAHTTAIAAGGETIAVVGTPICEVYPKENAALQTRIANEYLVISQIPVLRYLQQGIQRNRLFFPERNITMSALTVATIIVEAGETSGTLTQARAALAQKRKLLILENNFRNALLSWPAKYAALGALRVGKYDQIVQHLPPIEDGNGDAK
jgi:DNA processing protein